VDLFSSSESQVISPFIPLENVKFSEDEEIGKTDLGETFKGTFGKVNVAIKRLVCENVDDLKKLVEQLTHIKHQNLVRLYGGCFEGQILIISEYAQQRRDLYYILHSNRDTIKLNMNRKVSWIKDITKGMHWLHSLDEPIRHPLLSSRVLLITDDWRIKISEYGLKNYIYKNTGFIPRWQSPELIKKENNNEDVEITEKSDIYSYAITIWELLNQEIPFSDYEDDDEKNLSRFIKYISKSSNKRRPSKMKNYPSLQQIISDCWDEDPTKRPSFAAILDLLDDAIVDSILCHDTDSAILWKTFFKRQNEIDFTEFTSRLYDYVGKPKPRNDEDKKVDESYLSLVNVLSSKTQDQSLTVKIEDFNTAIRRFGPLKQGDSNFIDIVTAVYKEPWYFGDVNGSQATGLLFKEKKTFPFYGEMFKFFTG